MKNLISIIIPTFNRAELIQETLSSIVNQSYQEWECIIVDDGSTDNTNTSIRNFIKTDSRFQFHNRPAAMPKGANACRNYGLSLAKGSYINWFDSDDLMTPDHLSIHAGAHDQSSVAATVSMADVFRGDKRNIVRRWKSHSAIDDVLSEMAKTNILWPINCVCWNRTSLTDKPFLEDLASSQEWAFHLSQLTEGKTFKNINQVTCLVRDHEQRVGKSKAENKVFSTFESRRYILTKMNERNRITNDIELSLLKFIFLALRMSIIYKYRPLMMRILLYLAGYFLVARNKIPVLKAIFIATPVFLITGKGERLFNSKIDA